VGFDQLAKIDGARRVHHFAGELANHVRADLIALPANRGTEMHHEVAGMVAEATELGDAFQDDPSRGAAPARVKRGDGAGRMRDEHRYAVGDRDGERGAAIQ